MAAESPGQPLVSVIIPVYNGERYLAEAIESVLAQTHRPLEVIVVNDGSTDGSAALAAGFGPPVRVLDVARGGGVVARNQGAAVARGAWLAFLDADDLWLPDKLRLQLAAAEADPGVAVIFGGVEHFLSPELDERARQRLYCPLGIARGQLPSALLVRRATFASLGGFDATWRMGELIDWCARARDAGVREVTIPALTLRRRVHGANQSLREADERVDFVRIVKATLDRRRAAGLLARGTETTDEG